MSCHRSFWARLLTICFLLSVTQAGSVFISITSLFRSLNDILTKVVSQTQIRSSFSVISKAEIQGKFENCARELEFFSRFGITSFI